MTTGGSAPARARREREYRATVMVVDDDPITQRLVARALDGEGYQILRARDAQSASLLLARVRPDVIILDVQLPDLSGFEFLSQQPSATATPIIFLSGRGGEMDRVRGLDLGAVDYVVKPFFGREMAARVRAQLRGRVTEPPMHFGDLVIHVAERTVEVAGRSVRLTAREFDLLVYLARAAPRVVSRSELLEQVWRSSASWQSPATVTEHIRRIRAKLGGAATPGEWIQAVRGVGYQFVLAPQTVGSKATTARQVDDDQPSINFGADL